MPPFAESLPAGGMIMTSGVNLALTKIRCALHAGWQVIWLTGVEGIGKSTIWRAALAQAALDGWLTVALDNPLLAPAKALTRLTASLAEQAGLSPAAVDFDGAVAALLKSGKKICIGVDDVQAKAAVEILEHLRLALGLGEGGATRLHLLLCGQRQGEETLRQASGLLSQVSLRVIAQPCDLFETKRYILLRLKQAGCQRGIFTRQAADAIYRVTRGVPRQVNRLCALTLVLGYGLKVKKINSDLIVQAAANLGLITPRRRPAHQPAPPPPASPAATSPAVPLPAATTPSTASAAEEDVLAALASPTDEKQHPEDLQTEAEDVLAGLAPPPAVAPA